jgi:DNA repair protein RecO (recombination protein O)
MDLAETDNIEHAGIAGAAGKSKGPARRFEHQRGYVLHTYPYSETSLIVETFTREHGRVPLMAKGAKRPRSALRGALMQFQPVELSWSGRGDLRSLITADWLGGLPSLAGSGLFCGFYLNELLLKLLARDDAHERLFDCYENALRELAGLGRSGAGSGEAKILRGFERELLRETGYALNLTHEADSDAPIDPEARYAYDPEHGPRRLAPGRSADLELAGRTLVGIENNDYTAPQTAAQAKLLMRYLLNHQLNGKPLATRQIFSELQQL